MKPRKKRQLWLKFADFHIIKADDYDVQPEPEKALEKEDNNEQNKDISEKALENEKSKSMLQLLKHVYTIHQSHPITTHTKKTI